MDKKEVSRKSANSSDLRRRRGVGGNLEKSQFNNHFRSQSDATFDAKQENVRLRKNKCPKNDRE